MRPWQLTGLQVCTHRPRARACAADYPYGKIKVLATVGEYDKTSGFMLVGVPDGMGAYLKDDTTVRIVWQSESCTLHPPRCERICLYACDRS
jgi:hypothetical protein